MKLKHIKAEVKAIMMSCVVNEEKEEKFASEIKARMMKIPNIIDPSVPIGKETILKMFEVQRFGEPKVPDYEIPYHADIIEKLTEWIKNLQDVLVVLDSII